MPLRVWLEGSRNRVRAHGPSTPPASEAIRRLLAAALDRRGGAEPEPRLSVGHA